MNSRIPTFSSSIELEPLSHIFASRLFLEFAFLLFFLRGTLCIFIVINQHNKSFVYLTKSFALAPALHRVHRPLEWFRALDWRVGWGFLMSHVEFDNYHINCKIWSSNFEKII